MTPSEQELKDRVHRAWNFRAKQMGLDVQVSDDVIPATHANVSDVHRPFQYLPKFTVLKPHTVTDHDIARLLIIYGLDASDWAMARPNLKAVWQDFAKYSYDSDIKHGFSDDDLAWVVQYCANELAPALVGVDDWSPIPLHEAMAKMNGATSPGYPWNVRWHTKDGWRKAPIDHDAILREFLETKTCFWNVSFKEEVRPFQKLTENKARSFMSGPAEENVAGIMFLGKLLDAVVDSWRTIPITYGINQRARGWHVLLSRFFGLSVQAIDFSKFDGSLARFFFWLAYLVICELVPNILTDYGYLHDCIAAVIEAQILSPCVFSNGLIAWKKTGNPSGSSLTIFINSLIHMIVIALYLRVRHRLDEEEMKRVKMACHGDDGVHGTDRDLVGVLDFNDMNAFYANRGFTLVITTDNPEPVSVEHVVFLSQRSVKWGDIWVPVPEEPLKLIASAELRNDENVPDGWDKYAYHLARLIQITNQLVFTEYFDSMFAVVREYIALHELRDKSLINDISWNVAKRHMKPKHMLIASYVYSHYAFDECYDTDYALGLPASDVLDVDQVAPVFYVLGLTPEQVAETSHTWCLKACPPREKVSKLVAWETTSEVCSHIKMAQDAIISSPVVAATDEPQCVHKQVHKIYAVSGTPFADYCELSEYDRRNLLNVLLSPPGGPDEAPWGTDMDVPGCHFCGAKPPEQNHIGRNCTRRNPLHPECGRNGFGWLAARKSGHSKYGAQFTVTCRTDHAAAFLGVPGFVHMRFVGNADSPDILTPKFDVLPPPAACDICGTVETPVFVAKASDAAFEIGSIPPDTKVAYRVVVDGKKAIGDIGSGASKGDGPGKAKPAAKKAVKKAAKVARKAVKKEVKKVVKSAKKASKAAGKMVLRGHGDYADTIGTVVGSGIRRGVDWLSGKAKSWLGSLFGSGDYHGPSLNPDSNTLWHTQNAPEMMSTGHKPGVVRFREFIMNIQSAENFTTRSLHINPGLPSTFPWLSLSARAYQRYRVRGMVFEFVSTIGPYGGGNVNGSVILSARYDQSLPVPTTAQSALNSKFAVSGRPVDNVLMAVECARTMTPVNVHEIRAGALPDTADPSLYDLCIVDISNVGQADATNTIGQIWVSYEIELEFPVSEAGASTTTLSDKFEVSAATGAPFSSAVPDSSNSIGCVVSDTAIQFPPWVASGTYYLSACWNTTSSVNTSGISVASSLNCAAEIYFAGGSGSGFAPASGETSSRRSWNMVLRVTGQGAVLTVQNGTFSGSSPGVLTIMPISQDIAAMAWAKQRFGHVYLAQQTRDAEVFRRFAAMAKANDCALRPPRPEWEEEKTDDESVVEVPPRKRVGARA